MNELHIDPHHEPHCLPGEAIEGQARWSVDVDPPSAELRLLWLTRGKGTVDQRIVETIVFDHPRREDQRAFRFVLPNGPYTFSGRLVSLFWHLELVIQPGAQTKIVELIISPTGREIILPAIGKA